MKDMRNRPFHAQHIDSIFAALPVAIILCSISLAASVAKEHQFKDRQYAVSD